MTTTGLNSLIAKVGGEKNATILLGVAGAGGVWLVGRRKNAKSKQAPVNVMAQGYADTAQDPTALYTGYDQLQQEIDNLRNQQPSAGGSNPSTNPNPVPTATSPGSPVPAAPIPPPPDAPPPLPVQVAEHNTWGAPVTRYGPTPQQIVGPDPSFWGSGHGAVQNGGGGDGGGWSNGYDGPVGPRRRH